MRNKLPKPLAAAVVAFFVVHSHHRQPSGALVLAFTPAHPTRFASCQTTSHANIHRQDNASPFTAGTQLFVHETQNFRKSSTSSSPYLNDMTALGVDDEFARLVQEANRKRVESLRDASVVVPDEDVTDERLLELQEHEDSPFHHQPSWEDEPDTPGTDLITVDANAQEVQQQAQEEATWMGGEAALEGASTCSPFDEAIRQAEQLALDAIRSAEEEIRLAEEALAMEEEEQQEPLDKADTPDIASTVSIETIDKDTIENDGDDHQQQEQYLQQEYNGLGVAEARLASAGKGHNDDGDDDDDEDDDSNAFVENDATYVAATVDNSNVVSLPFFSSWIPTPPSIETSSSETKTSLHAQLLAKQEEELCRAEQLAEEQLRQVEQELCQLAEAEANEDKFELDFLVADIVSSFWKAVSPAQDVIASMVDQLTPLAKDRSVEQPFNHHEQEKKTTGALDTVTSRLQMAAATAEETVKTAAASFGTYFESLTAGTGPRNEVVNADTTRKAIPALLSAASAFTASLRSAVDSFSEATAKPQSIALLSPVSYKEQSNAALVSDTVPQEAVMIVETANLAVAAMAEAFLQTRFGRKPVSSGDDATIGAPQSRPPAKTTALLDSTLEFGVKQGKVVHGLFDKLGQDASTELAMFQEFATASFETAVRDVTSTAKEFLENRLGRTVSSSGDDVVVTALDESTSTSTPLLDSRLKLEWKEQAELAKGLFDKLREVTSDGQDRVTLLLDSAINFGIDQNQRVDEFLDKLRDGTSPGGAGPLFLDSTLEFGVKQGKRVQDYFDQQLHRNVSNIEEKGTTPIESNNDLSFFFSNWE